MKTKKQKQYLISLGCAMMFVGIIFVAVGIARAASTDNVAGWLWGGSDDGAGNSSGLGWISMNNTNTAGAFAYGVDIPSSDGNLSGYAWSENLGWISFNVADLAGCPSGICAAYRSGSSIQGWARFLSISQSGANSGGWLGWIKLAGTAQNGATYGVTLAGDGTLSGFAWSDELGYIDFSRAAATNTPPPTAPVVTLSANPFTIDVDSNPLPQNVALTWTAANATSCTKSGGAWSGTVASPTGATDTVSQATPTVTYSISCVGSGGTTVVPVIVTTSCNNAACSGSTCANTPVYGVTSASSCTKSCTSDADCAAPSNTQSGGIIREVTP